MSHLSIFSLAVMTLDIVLLVFVTWLKMSVHVSRDFSITEVAATLKGPPDNVGGDACDDIGPLAILLQLSGGQEALLLAG